MPLDNKAIDALGNKLRELRYDQFICNWKMDLHQRDKLPKLDTYKIIKNDYRIEPHIPCTLRAEQAVSASSNTIEGQFS